MKLAVAVALFFWLLCGLIGAWMIEGDDDLRLKTIARGPMTLIKALGDEPVHYPDGGA